MQGEQITENNGSFRGYLDYVLETLDKYKHPCVLVGLRATNWMSSRGASKDGGFDLLLRACQFDHIAIDLINSEHWKLYERRRESYGDSPDSDADNSFSYHPAAGINNDADIVLEWTGPDMNEIAYLRLWSEDTYLMSVDSPLVEVPDIISWNFHLVEEKWHPAAERTDGYWYGPSTLSSKNGQIIPPESQRARSPQISTPIYVPTIPVFVDAMLDQQRLKSQVWPSLVFFAGWHLRNLTRYLFLELPHQKARILGEISARNRPSMAERLENHKRKPKLGFTVDKEEYYVKVWEPPEPWERRYQYWEAVKPVERSEE